jgi:bla regulator protein blaR1
MNAAVLMRRPRPSGNRNAKALLFGFLVFSSSRLTGILSAQSMPEEPGRFEVASIRPSDVKGGRPSFESNPGGGVRATNVTLKLLIQVAYDIRPEQLSGGPGWTDSEQYSVIAKGPEDGSPLSAAEQKALTRKRLQALLSERFHLALKLEANPASGYVLTVEKKGHKMTVANDPGARQLRQVGRWEIRAEGVEMSILARFLSVHLQATMVDRTGLEGRYNFHLNWTPVPLPSSIASLNELPEDSLIPAVQEQLGLRLERQKVATDRYTIERAEKPTEN